MKNFLIFCYNSKYIILIKFVDIVEWKQKTFDNDKNKKLIKLMSIVERRNIKSTLKNYKNNVNTSVVQV